MRPRVFPAEDCRVGAVMAWQQGGFNEAAGIPRGRLVSLLQHIERDRASMRPRVFPAEDGVGPFITRAQMEQLQ